MSPAFLRHRSRTAADIHVLSARSAVVTSLNGWQIFGIVVIVVVLGLLVGGWFWYQKRSARHPPVSDEAQPPVEAAADNSSGKGTATTSEGQGQELAMHDLARPLSWISHYGTEPAHPPPGARTTGESPPNGSNVPWPNLNSNALRLENMFHADGTDAVAATMGSPGDMTATESAAVVPAASRVKTAPANVEPEAAPVDAVSAPEADEKNNSAPAELAPPPSTKSDSDYFGAANVVPVAPSSSRPASADMATRAGGS
ncbi:hypothetical protein DFH06DRAFT_1209615 [Mycena polygramma]|nr:hypothetical protein DFH06DRAFT_1209615 [Mycena polygramma]